MSGIKVEFGQLVKTAITVCKSLSVQCNKTTFMYLKLARKTLTYMFSSFSEIKKMLYKINIQTNYFNLLQYIRPCNMFDSLFIHNI